MLEILLFTLARREEHVAILAVHSTEGFLLVRILVGYIVWQETAEDHSRRVNILVIFKSGAMKCTFSMLLFLFVLKRKLITIAFLRLILK